MTLEILNRAFVFLRCSLCIERAKVSAFSRLRIFLARIQPIFTGFQFPDHVSLNIRRRTTLRASICRATASVAQSRHAGGAPALQRLGRTIRNQKRNQRGENGEIGREVCGETPMLASVTETAAADVESANFGRDGGEGEDHD